MTKIGLFSTVSLSYHHEKNSIWYFSHTQLTYTDLFFFYKDTLVLPKYPDLGFIFCLLQQNLLTWADMVLQPQTSYERDITIHFSADCGGVLYLRWKADVNCVLNSNSCTNSFNVDAVKERH